MAGRARVTTTLGAHLRLRASHIDGLVHVVSVLVTANRAVLQVRYPELTAFGSITVAERERTRARVLQGMLQAEIAPPRKVKVEIVS